MGLFSWGERHVSVDTSALGSSAIAMRVGTGCSVAAPCVALVFDRAGHIRRAEDGRITLVNDEAACCFHPGPYMVDLIAYPSAPELCLRLAFVVDAPDPRLIQQRFDLFLASETDGALATAALHDAMVAALRRELAQGNLELPPCTSLHEWTAFRAGLNQLLYTRFGVTILDCVPTDLGGSVDYAKLLLARTAGAPLPELPAALPPWPVPEDAPGMDAKALRRLFLELPCIMCAVRLAVLPPGQEQFARHQMLLHRLDQVSLSVNTMPALELAAPGQVLAHAEQARRSRHSTGAAAALDESWALLARLETSDDEQIESMFDEADRIIANLEHHCAQRRAAHAGGGAV